MPLYRCRHLDVKRVLQRSLDSMRGINEMVGRYGIKIESSVNLTTAKYANFNNLMEIVKAFPGRIPAEVVVENSDLANKESIIERIVSGGDGFR